MKNPYLRRTLLQTRRLKNRVEQCSYVLTRVIPFSPLVGLLGSGMHDFLLICNASMNRKDIPATSESTVSALGFLDVSCVFGCKQ